MKKFLTGVINYYATHLNFPPRGFKIFFQYCKFVGIEQTRFLKKLPSGILMELNITDHIQRQLFWHNGYETDEINIIGLLLQSNDNFLDAGANIGNHSLHIAQHLKNGTVIAFEPSPKTFEQFNGNIALNNFRNIIAVQKALSDKNEKVTLFLSEAENIGSTGLSASDEFSGETVTVNTITGDEWLQQNFKNRIAGIKIDVEGHELEALEGLQNTIERDKPFLMIEILESTLARFKHTPRDIYQLLYALDYSAWVPSGKKLITVDYPFQEGYSIFFLQKHHVDQLKTII